MLITLVMTCLLYGGTEQFCNNAPDVEIEKFIEKKMWGTSKDDSSQTTFQDDAVGDSTSNNIPLQTGTVGDSALGTIAAQKAKPIDKKKR